jgi:hypothetical protein
LVWSIWVFIEMLKDQALTRAFIVIAVLGVVVTTAAAQTSVPYPQIFVPFREPPWKIIHPIPLDAAQLAALPEFVRACKAMASRTWTLKTRAEWDMSCENGQRLER